MKTPAKPKPSAAPKALATQSAVNSAVWSICDIMRRSNCAGAMQYVPELTWILFLRILDEREANEVEAAKAVGANFRPSLEAPYRWRDWAAPGAAKRDELREGKTGAYFSFVNGELIPHLKKLRDNPNATPRQKVISEIISGVDRTRIDTERNFLDVLDKVDELTAASVDDTHVFALSQVYEGLLLKMGEKGNDGGSFSRRAKSCARSSKSSHRKSARRCMTLAAERADFSRRHTNSWRADSATSTPATRSKRSSTARSTDAKRRT